MSCKYSRWLNLPLSGKGYSKPFPRGNYLKVLLNAPEFDRWHGVRRQTLVTLGTDKQEPFARSTTTLDLSFST
jgi:hypothetical protein